MRVLVRHIDTDAFEALLDKRRMSKRELAERTGLSYTFIKYLASGQRNPRRGSAERIAAVLKVPVRRFVVETSVPRRRRALSPDHTTPGAA